MAFEIASHNVCSKSRPSEQSDIIKPQQLIYFIDVIHKQYHELGRFSLRG